MDSYCAKCFETFAEGSNVLPTPCGHIFHKTCLSKMLGTVHILRKHSNSTNFSQKLFFLSKQQNLFFNITFWRNFHAVFWNF